MTPGHCSYWLEDGQFSEVLNRMKSQQELYFLRLSTKVSTLAIQPDFELDRPDFFCRTFGLEEGRFKPLVPSHRVEIP